MPHKHKRKHNALGKSDKEHFDLAPDAEVRPLSVHKTKHTTFAGFDDDAETKPNKRRKPNEQVGDSRKKQKSRKTVDDTPKNFLRLMRWQNEGKALPKGEDTGERPKKTKKLGERKPATAKDKPTQENGHGVKPKATAASLKPNDLASTSTKAKDTSTTATPSAQTAAEKAKLRILPGERLSDFSLRVDQSLPLTSIPKPSTKSSDKALGLKKNLTKHNKRLARMQSEWRNTEAKLKAREEDEDGEREEQKEEEGWLWMDVEAVRSDRKGRKKRRGDGEVDGGDIWKVLERKRREAGERKVGVGVGEMVKAPPVLKGVRDIFKVKVDARRAVVGA